MELRKAQCSERHIGEIVRMCKDHCSEFLAREPLLSSSPSPENDPEKFNRDIASSAKNREKKLLPNVPLKGGGF
ncbi:hypothetical protein Lal_00042947 [Lupinus albus]|nr:hypothetical protein Lal_00042947 [Lupinus albus]